LRWLLGLALAPTAAGALWAAAWNLSRLVAKPGAASPFLFGLGAYLAAHFLLARFSRIYVLGHELSHAIAAWMSGAKVLGFKVTKKGGHVDVSHSNAWIALAPYVVPLYALALVGLYRLMLWSPPHPFLLTRLAHRGFLFALGLAVSFHLVQTGDALWGQHQPDLDHAGGVVFSLAVIALANGFFFVLALKCLFPHAVSFAASAELVWKLTENCWGFLFAPIRGLAGLA
jgi:hypothetical protein